MVRTYIPKRRNTYSQVDLDTAIRKVQEDGFSIGKASKHCKIPKETLRRWANTAQNPSRIGSGRFTSALSESEEELIVITLEETARRGWPCGPEEVKLMVESFLNKVGRKTQLKENRPGEDWMINFKKKWNHRLSFRKPEVLTKARAASLSVQTLDEFFNLLFDVYSENGLSDAEDASQRIYNCDETGCNTNPISTKMFFKKSSKEAYMMTPNCGKTMYTVLVAGSAAGEYLPPLILFKGKYLYQSWTTLGPPGTTYAVSESGWMSDIVFENWFATSFVPFVSEKRKPVVLTFDGHGSHLTYGTIMKAMEENIIIVCLPPNTSHALQPLDVAVFKPFKEQWRRILLQFYRETKMKTVDKAVFPSLMNKLWFKISATNLVSVFRGSGLWPLNRDAIHNAKSMDSELDFQAASTSNDENVNSPRKLLREAIVDVIAPPVSKETSDALENSKRKRARVQAKTGEVLTTPEVAKRLKVEMLNRESRKAQINGQVKARNHVKTPTRPSKYPHSAENYVSSDDENEDDENDNIACIICKQIWWLYKGKKKEVWLICDICDGYVCSKCSPTAFDENSDYYCASCSAGDI